MADAIHVRKARNTVESLTYVRKLKAMNIGVMFEEQNINSLTTDSEMFVGLYSVIAQAESENISANVRWGIQQRMKKGIAYGISGDESVLSTFNIDQNIAQLKGQIQTLMDTVGKTEGDKERYFDEISKLYLQITALREEKKKIQIQMDAQEETEKEIKRINKLLEGFDISFGEFDDIVARRIIDCIKVVNNEELLIIVKGGLEIKEKIHVE